MKFTFKTGFTALYAYYFRAFPEFERYYRRLIARTYPGITIAVSVAAALALAVMKIIPNSGVTAVAYTFLSALMIVFGWPYFLRPLGGRCGFSGALMLGALLGFGLPLIVLGSIVLMRVPPSSFVTADVPSIFVACLAAPIAETLIFHMWVQTRIGLLLAALIFVATHFTLSPLLIALAIGLGVMRARTKSLLAVGFAHFSFNVAVFIFAIFYLHKSVHFWPG